MTIKRLAMDYGLLALKYGACISAAAALGTSVPSFADEGDLARVHDCSRIEMRLHILGIKHDFGGPGLSKGYRAMIESLAGEYEKCGCGTAEVVNEPPFGTIGEIKFSRQPWWEKYNR
jgi:hypothetical protein